MLRTKELRPGPTKSSPASPMLNGLDDERVKLDGVVAGAAFVNPGIPITSASVLPLPNTTLPAKLVAAAMGFVAP